MSAADARRRFGGLPGTAIALALAMFALELVAITQYDYFRDELYYLASTRYPAAGYVDHPPLSILVLTAWTAVAGDSLVALRLPPAVNGAAAVLIAVLLCVRFRGGRFAQILTGLAVIFCGYLAIHHYYSMNTFDLLFWALAFLLVDRLVERDSRRDWLLLGLVLGLGLLNKISVLWLGAGLLVGLLLSRHRRLLATPGPWLAGLLAAALFSPYLFWQLRHGWPTLEFMENAATGKMVSLSPLEFFSGQVRYMNPLHVPLWLLGLGALLLAPRLASRRIFAWIYLTVVAILLWAGQSKSFYLGPAYPPLLAAGAVTLERLLGRPRRAWGRPVVAAAMLAGGIALTPLALPILPPESFVRYTETIGMRPRAEERHAATELPQQYADMFGWREMAAAVAEVWQGLPAADRERCVIFAQNYGEAGAIDLFGRRLGLPGAISGHNSYWFWGPGERSGEVAIVIGSSLEENLEFFEEVTRVATHRHRYAMPYETELPIFVARHPRRSWAEAWPALRRFI